jgi:hypothetical protein
VNEKAIVLTVEAMLSLLLFAVIATLPLQSQETSLAELLILQKENDLLKVWLLQESLPSEAEMLKDFETVFPQSSGTIEVDGKKIEVARKQADSASKIVSTAIFFDSALQRHEIRLTVYN